MIMRIRLWKAALMSALVLAGGDALAHHSFAMFDQKKDVTLKGFWLARWFRTTPQARQVALLTELAGLIAAGKLSTPIQATYDVEQIKEAVAAAAAGERQGKILITPGH